MSTRRIRLVVLAVILGYGSLLESASAQQAKRSLAYVEIEGQAEDFSFTRNWSSYYWREDFTFLLKDAQGREHRVISREPTPWTDLRLGTTFPGLAVDWKTNPRVKIIGVRGIDRIPVGYYDRKLDAEKTVTAFILRVRQGEEWKDFYVSNWFHDWSPETDRKMLAHFANDSPHYTVYGYLNGIAAPFDKKGQELIKQYEAEYGGIIYHGRVQRAENDVGYEVRILHLMGRHKKSLDYKVFHGSPAEIPKLDGTAPEKKKGKKGEREKRSPISPVLSFSLSPLLLFQPPKRNYPLAELEGKVEEFSFTRNWRSYYWREDFTMLIRDDNGLTHRVISREPTPWNGYRLGTTYTNLPVDWSARPRVQVIGVRAIDRQPEVYYDLKLDPEKTVTAFIVRVRQDPAWKDFYVNNWFHQWGAETDRKILAQYANDSPHYTVYGYLGSNVAPFAKESQEILKKGEAEFQPIIYHGRVQAANNEIGYEVRLLHVLGRNKKTQESGVVHGNPNDVPRLDGKAPPEANKKAK